VSFVAVERETPSQETVGKRSSLNDSVKEKSKEEDGLRKRGRAKTRKELQWRHYAVAPGRKPPERKKRGEAQVFGATGNPSVRKGEKLGR